MAEIDILFEKICKVTLTSIEDKREFYELWKKIMLKYNNISLLNEAFEQIIAENDKWHVFDISVWVSKMDYLHYKQKLTERPIETHQTEKPIQTSGQPVNWKHNLNLFVTQQISRRSYLENALKHYQMTQSEHDAEIERYNRLGMDLDGFCTNLLNISL